MSRNRLPQYLPDDQPAPLWQQAAAALRALLREARWGIVGAAEVAAWLGTCPAVAELALAQAERMGAVRYAGGPWVLA